MNNILVDQNLNKSIDALETLKNSGMIPVELYQKTKDDLMNDLIKRLDFQHTASVRLLECRDISIKSLNDFLKEKDLSKEFDDFAAKGNYGLEEKISDYCRSAIKSAEYLKSKGESLSRGMIDELIQARQFLQIK